MENSVSTYIATFYSHFGAIRYKKLCESQGLQAVIMPVPRSLSSSCGSCVKLTAVEVPEVTGEIHNEIEQIVQVVKGSYLKLPK